MNHATRRGLAPRAAPPAQLSWPLQGGAGRAGRSCPMPAPLCIPTYLSLHASTCLPRAHPPTHPLKKKKQQAPHPHPPHPTFLSSSQIHRWTPSRTTTCTATTWRAWWAWASPTSLPPRVGARVGLSFWSASLGRPLKGLGRCLCPPPRPGKALAGHHSVPATHVAPSPPSTGERRQAA